MTDQSKDEKLIREVKELTDLFEIAKTVVSTLDLDKVLSSILRSAMDIADTPSGSIALYDEESNMMIIHAAKGFSKEFMTQKSWPVRKGGLTEKILRNKYPVIIDDTKRRRYFNNPLAKAEGIEALVAAPLIFHDKIVGILYVDDFKKRKFSKNSLRLLSILSSFAAMSIDNAKLHEETFKLAITDGLTNLYNHRYFQEALEDEVARAKRYNLYTSLILLDIDDFKKLNDRHGHQIGDKILKKVSKSIQKSIREVDCASRYGGEEFAIILPEIDIESAYVVAERIRNSIITDTKGFFEDADSDVTVTLGIASYPIDALDKDELIRRSDEALYYGKRTGKNCTTRYDKLETHYDNDKSKPHKTISEVKE